jgi:hypothetical protein
MYFSCMYELNNERKSTFVSILRLVLGGHSLYVWCSKITKNERIDTGTRNC